MDHDFLTNALKTAYGADFEVCRPLANGAKAIFLVEATTHPSSWVVRALPAEADDYHTASFVSAAQILTYLEQQSYPTERLAPTVFGETTALVHGWRLMVTTYLGRPLKRWQGEFGEDGNVLLGISLAGGRQHTISSAGFIELGAALGRLHTPPTEPNQRLERKSKL